MCKSVAVIESELKVVKGTLEKTKEVLDNAERTISSLEGAVSDVTSQLKDVRSDLAAVISLLPKAAEIEVPQPQIFNLMNYIPLSGVFVPGMGSSSQAEVAPQLKPPTVIEEGPRCPQGHICTRLENGQLPTSLEATGNAVCTVCKREGVEKEGALLYCEPCGWCQCSTCIGTATGSQSGEQGTESAAEVTSASDASKAAEIAFKILPPEPPKEEVLKVDDPKTEAPKDEASTGGNPKPKVRKAKTSKEVKAEAPRTDE